MTDRSHRTARIWAVVGASGTGKGLWIKSQLRALRPSRLIVWDYLSEYASHAPREFRSLDQLRTAMIEAGEGGSLRARYVPRGTGQRQTRDEFERLCAMVYAWEDCTFVAEELSNVTTPSWAPPAWRMVSTSGRHAGLHVIGTTQTPAMVDKAFFGNCTLIHCSALREHPHRMTIARSMDVPVEQLAELKPLEWLERDFATGEVRRGRVAPPRARRP